jgi:hypothetical protein
MGDVKSTKRFGPCSAANIIVEEVAAEGLIVVIRF